MEENTDSDFFVVDRIEGNIAVCEKRDNKSIVLISILKLPEGVKEGTVIRNIDGKYIIDLEEQNKIEERIQQKMDNLWN